MTCGIRFIAHHTFFYPTSSCRNVSPPATATPRTVFAFTESVGGAPSGSARIISTPFLTRNSNAVPCGNKLFAAIYPSMLSDHPLRSSSTASSSASSPEDASLQINNVVHTSSSVISVQIDYLGSTAVFLNVLSGSHHTPATRTMQPQCSHASLQRVLHRLG